MVDNKIKREKFRGKYYWALTVDNKTVERIPYKKTKTKKSIQTHFEKYKTIDTNLLHRSKYTNFIKTVTVKPPRNRENSQMKVEYDIIVNGKKLAKTGFGISRKGSNTDDLRQSARYHGIRHIRGKLASMGIITYVDVVELRVKSEAYINWSPRRRVKK